MDDEPYEPIEVNQSSVFAQFGSAMRYTITAIGAYALGKGWVGEGELQLATVILTVLAPAAYGVFSTWLNRKKMVDLVKSVPDYMAVLK